MRKSPELRHFTQLRKQRIGQIPPMDRKIRRNLGPPQFGKPHRFALAFLFRVPYLAD
jgi:hypothetical protein